MKGGGFLFKHILKIVVLGKKKNQTYKNTAVFQVFTAFLQK